MHRVAILFFLTWLPLSAAAKSILFVGNSLTYYNNVPRLFQQVAEFSGHEIEVDMLAQGGISIAGHLSGGQFEQAVEQKAFDYVVLQDIGGWHALRAGARSV